MGISDPRIDSTQKQDHFFDPGDLSFDMLERVSGGKLPTWMQQSLVWHQIPQEHAKRAAVQLARDMTLTTESYKPDFEPNMGSFFDPVNNKGRPSYATINRQMTPVTEQMVLFKILKQFPNADYPSAARLTKMIKQGDVDLDGANWEDIIGMVVGSSTPTIWDPKTKTRVPNPAYIPLKDQSRFGENLLPLANLGMSPIDQIYYAQVAAVNNIRLVGPGDPVPEPDEGIFAPPAPPARVVMHPGALGVTAADHDAPRATPPEVKVVPAAAWQAFMKTPLDKYKMQALMTVWEAMYRIDQGERDMAHGDEALATKPETDAQVQAKGIIPPSQDLAIGVSGVQPPSTLEHAKAVLEKRTVETPGYELVSKILKGDPVQVYKDYRSKVIDRIKTEDQPGWMDRNIFHYVDHVLDEGKKGLMLGFMGAGTLLGVGLQLGGLAPWSGDHETFMSGVEQNAEQWWGIMNNDIKSFTQVFEEDGYPPFIAATAGMVADFYSDPLVWAFAPFRLLRFARGFVPGGFRATEVGTKMIGRFLNWAIDESSYGKRVLAGIDMETATKKSYPFFYRALDAFNPMTNANMDRKFRRWYGTTFWDYLKDAALKTHPTAEGKVAQDLVLAKLDEIKTLSTLDKNSARVKKFLDDSPTMTSENLVQLYLQVDDAVPQYVRNWLKGIMGKVPDAPASVAERLRTTVGEEYGTQTLANMAYAVDRLRDDGLHLVGADAELYTKLNEELGPLLENSAKLNRKKGVMMWNMALDRFRVHYDDRQIPAQLQEAIRLLMYKHLDRGGDIEELREPIAQLLRGAMGLASRNHYHPAAGLVYALEEGTTDLRVTMNWMRGETQTGRSFFGDQPLGTPFPGNEPLPLNRAGRMDRIFEIDKRLTAIDEEQAALIHRAGTPESKNRMFEDLQLERFRLNQELRDLRGGIKRGERATVEENGEKVQKELTDVQAVDYGLELEEKTLEGTGVKGVMSGDLRGGAQVQQVTPLGQYITKTLKRGSLQTKHAGGTMSDTEYIQWAKDYLHEQEYIWANALNSLETGADMRYGIHYLGHRPLFGKMPLSMRLWGDNAFGKGWQAAGNLVPSLLPNLEQDLPMWVRWFTTRGRTMNIDEQGRFMERALKLADPHYGAARTDDFVHLLEDIQMQQWRHYGRLYGIPPKRIQALVNEWRRHEFKAVQGIYGLSELEDIDNLPQLIDYLRAQAKVYSKPLDITQLLNTWPVSDPLQVKGMLADYIGLRRRFMQAARRTLGIDPKVLDKLEATTVWPGIRDGVIRTGDWYLRWWKPLVVITPRYAFRVPLFDEQIRFLLSLGPGERFRQSKIGRMTVGKFEVPPEWVFPMSGDEARFITKEMTNVGFGGVGIDPWDEAFDAVKLAHDTKASGVVTKADEVVLKKLNDLSDGTRDILERTYENRRTPNTFHSLYTEPLGPGQPAVATGGKGRTYGITYMHGNPLDESKRLGLGMGKTYANYKDIKMVIVKDEDTLAQVTMTWNKNSVHVAGDLDKELALRIITDKMRSILSTSELQHLRRRVWDLKYQNYFVQYFKRNPINPETGVPITADEIIDLWEAGRLPEMQMKYLDNRFQWKKPLVEDEISQGMHIPGEDTWPTEYHPEENVTMPGGDDWMEWNKQSDVEKAIFTHDVITKELREELKGLSGEAVTTSREQMAMKATNVPKYKGGATSLEVELDPYTTGAFGHLTVDWSMGVPRVTHVEVNELRRGQNLAESLYLRAAREARKRTGQELMSSGEREMPAAVKRVWEKLEEKGLAHKVGRGQYQMIAPAQREWQGGTQLAELSLQKELLERNLTIKNGVLPKVAQSTEVEEMGVAVVGGSIPWYQYKDVMPEGDYWYHVTPVDRFAGIKELGLIKRMHPRGPKVDRGGIFFAPDATKINMHAPSRGDSVILRVKKSDVTVERPQEWGPPVREFKGQPEGARPDIWGVLEDEKEIKGGFSFDRSDGREHFIEEYKYWQEKAATVTEGTQGSVRYELVQDSWRRINGLDPKAETVIPRDPGELYDALKAKGELPHPRTTYHPEPPATEVVSREKVPSDVIEYYGADGEWHNIGANINRHYSPQHHGTETHEIGHVIHGRLIKGKHEALELEQGAGPAYEKWFDGDGKILRDLEDAWTKDGHVTFEEFNESLAEAWRLYNIDKDSFKTIWPTWGRVFDRHENRMRMIEGQFRKYGTIEYTEAGKYGRMFPLQGDVRRELGPILGAEIGLNKGEIAMSMREQAKMISINASKTTHSGALVWGPLSPLRSNGMPDPRYVSHWLWALKYQFGQGVFSKVVLQQIRNNRTEEQAVDALLAFVREGDTFTRASMEALGVHDELSMIQKVEDLTKTIYLYTKGGGEVTPKMIAEGILDQDIRKFTSLLQRVPVEDRIVINALDVVRVSGKNNILDSAYNTLTKWLMQDITNNVSRQPFAKAHYKFMKEWLLNLAEHQRLPMGRADVARIEAEATQYAADRTQAIMFNFRTQSRVGEMLRFVYPFFQPFMEQFIVYGKLLRENPGAFATAAHVLKFLNEHIFGKDPQTGDPVIPMQWFQHSVMLLLGIGTMGRLYPPELTGSLIGGNLKDPKNHAKLGGFSLYGKVQSMNFMFANMLDLPLPGGGTFPIPFPSMSVPITAAVQWFTNVFGLLKGGEAGSYSARWKNALYSQLFAYGDVTKGNFLHALLPRWLGLGMPKPEVTQGQVINQLQLLYANGIDPQFLVESKQAPDIATAKAMLQKQAEGQVDQINWFMMIGTLFSPMSLDLRFPLDALKIEHQKFVDKYDWEKGTELFNKKHPGYEYLTVPASHAVAVNTQFAMSLPANRIVDRLLEQPFMEDAAREFPDLVAFLIPHELWGEEYDRAIGIRQFDEGLRENKTALEWINDVESMEFYDAWRMRRDDWDRQEDDLLHGTSPLDKEDSTYLSERQKYYDDVDKIGLLYPTAFEEFKTRRDMGIDEKVEEELREAARNKAFAGTDAGGFLDWYWRNRDILYDKMRKNNQSSLYNPSAERWRTVWEEQLDLAFAKWPDGKRLYNLMLNQDLYGDIDTKATEIYRELGLPKNQVGYKEQQVWERQWNKWTKAVDQSSNEYDTNKAYWELRELSRSATEEDWAFRLNPQQVWWQTSTANEKQGYIQSIRNRPAIFWSSFDRKLMGLPTNHEAEVMWSDIASRRATIAEWKRQHPFETDAPPEMYQESDRQVRELAATNDVFYRQVMVANTWGWALENSSLTQDQTTASESWTHIFNMVHELQLSLTQKEATGIKDFDLEHRADWIGARELVEDELARYAQGNPLFKTQMKHLEESNRSTPLAEQLIPDVYFPLGGYDFVEEWLLYERQLRRLRL